MCDTQTGDGAAHAAVCLDALIGLDNLSYIDLDIANVSQKGYEGLDKMPEAAGADMQIFEELGFMSFMVLDLFYPGLPWVLEGAFLSLI